MTESSRPDGRTLCFECGADLGSFQYCTNCGHDSAIAPGTRSAGSSPGSVAEQIAVLVAQSGGKVAETGAVFDLSVAEQNLERSRTEAVGSGVLSEQAPASTELASTGAAAPPAGPAGIRLSGPQWIAVAAVATLVVGFGATRLLGSQDPASSSAVDRQAAAGASVDPEAVVPASPAAASSDAAQTPPDQTWTCWDGSSESSQAACSAPEGADGLAWVFPGATGDGCAAVTVAGRRTAFSCPGPSGTDASTKVVYGQLFSVRAGVGEFARKFPGNLVEPESPGADRFVWCASAPNSDGIWEAASMYVHRPWVVEVQAKSLKKLKKALGGVQFRPAAELRGQGPAT